MLTSQLTSTLILGQDSNDLLEFEPLYTRLVVPEGGNKVMKVFQDSTGFLWIASHIGLVRYDGQRFITFKSDSLNENSPATPFLENLYQDSKGMLWMAHAKGGLTSFDPIREQFRRYTFELPYADVVNDGWTPCVVEDQDGFIWAGTNHGVYRLDRESGQYKRFVHDEKDPRSLSHDVSRVLYVDREGTLWVGTGFPWAEKPEDREKKLGGLNRYDADTESFERFVHDPNDSTALRDNRIGSIFEDSRGIFWIGTWGDGIHQMDRTEGTFQHFPSDPVNPHQLSQPFKRNIPIADQPNCWVTCIGEDHKHRIWIGAWSGGLNVFDPATGKTRHFENDPEDAYGLPHDNIIDFHETKDGTLFFSTSSSRVLFKMNEADKFLYHDLGNFINAPKTEILDIIEDDRGNIWLGTKGVGLIQFNPKNDALQVHKLNPGDSNSLTSNHVTSVREALDGHLWISTMNGLNRFDPANATFTRYQYRPGSGGSLSYWSGVPSIKPAFQDNKEDIWVLAASPRGLLNRLNRNTRQFENFMLHEKEGSILEGEYGQICEDNEGRLWFGTMSHLVSYHHPSRTTKKFRLPEDLQGAEQVAADDEGKIWFRSASNELGRLDPSSGAMKVFSIDNSDIPSDKIYTLLQSPDGRLWMSAPNTLIALDPEKELFQSYHSPPDLLDGPGFVNSEGKLFFVSGTGYYEIDPEELKLKDSQYVPRILITDLIIEEARIVPGDLSILTEPIWKTQSLRLPYNRNSFSLGLACVDYRNPAAHRFKYQLENYDQNWRTLLEEGLAKYRKVPPGKYVFRVQGADSDGIWNREGKVLHVTVLPPWWATGWAWMFFGLLLLAVLYYIRSLELRKQRRKLAFQEEVNALTSKFVPTAFIRALGHDNIMDVKLGDSAAQEVSVMFSDIRNYTTLSENMTPEENFRFVHAFNQRMGPLIQQNQGFVNQYLGDAIMALFKNSPSDCLRAAVHMQRSLQSFNRERANEALSSIQLGIGLHTGPLVMGIIGDEYRMDATTISDTVNTASRIESLTKYFGVNILLSEESLRQIQNSGTTDYLFRFLGKVLLKGKKEPTAVYECFDGDSPDVIESKVMSHSLFDEAMERYLSRNFKEAAMIFEKVMSIHPEDLPAQFFCKRSTNYQTYGVAEDWDGVEVMTFK